FMQCFASYISNNILNINNIITFFCQFSLIIAAENIEGILLIGKQKKHEVDVIMDYKIQVGMLQG
ncbi:hypothetical protein ACJX0J_021577, partial [Zea mays]